MSVRIRPRPRNAHESAPAVCLLDADERRRQTVAAALETRAPLVRIAETDVEAADAGVVLLGLSEPLIQPPDLRAIQRLHARGVPVVIAYGSGMDAVPLGARCQALLQGAACLLDSGVASFAAELERRLEAALDDLQRQRVEQNGLRATMAPLGLVGASPPMLALFRWIARVSTLSDVAVLVHGETGTGKELVARAIHGLDAKRSRGPFVPLNCSALSAELAESELFGSRKGAFTGATHDRRGLVRSADGGVLFLDEIGDLAPGLQAKLLRVLQEGRVMGVGDDREVPVDVRVVAATNRDLRAMVDEGRFRADLYHRLGVLVATVPALAERAGDVALLIDHFLMKYQALRPCRAPASPAFVSALQRLRLPGNVRQLQNLVRHALVKRSDDTPLGLEDLPPEALRQLSVDLPPDGELASELPADWIPILESHGWSLARSLSACERMLVRAALGRARGNQSETARLLGVTARSIYNKIRKHHLHD